MSKNIIDKMVGFFSPKAALKRAQFRGALALYEAAKPSRLRKSGADNSSGDAVVGRGGVAMRGYARQLEQNYDIANGVLNVLVNNTIGANGISVEFQPKDKDGNIHQELAKQLEEAHKDWKLKPEVTHEHDWISAQRLAARSWFRDGELLTQMLNGKVPGLVHGTRVPFSIELIEADLMPFDYTDDNKGITQGVQRNAWGKPTAYHIFKQHPGDDRAYLNLTTKQVPASRMLHPKITTRIRQARGVSIFASVITRLEDIKDYEESERVAARISAAMAGYIKKGSPDVYEAPSEPNQTDRHFSLKPGIIFDNLQPGEEVGTIQSNRPSALAGPFIELQQRGIASGTGANHSSISKNYNGTYSAQRQELVEGWGNYASCTMLFVAQYVRPITRNFTDMAILSGIVTVPDNLDMLTLYDADYRGPAMPWIDPDKEAKANERMERSGYKSAQMIIRERGNNPADVRDQIKTWRNKNDEDGLLFTTDMKNDKPESPADAGLSTSSEEENKNDEEKDDEQQNKNS